MQFECHQERYFIRIKKIVEPNYNVAYSWILSIENIMKAGRANLQVHLVARRPHCLIITSINISQYSRRCSSRSPCYYGRWHEQIRWWARRITVLRRRAEMVLTSLLFIGHNELTVYWTFRIDLRPQKEWTELFLNIYLCEHCFGCKGVKLNLPHWAYRVSSGTDKKGKNLKLLPLQVLNTSFKISEQM